MMVKGGSLVGVKQEISLYKILESLDQGYQIRYPMLLNIKDRKFNFIELVK